MPPPPPPPPPHVVCLSCRLPALVLLDGLISRRRHADSHVALYRDGWGGAYSSHKRFFFSTRRRHIHAKTEAVAD
jgi:hypothetical protein